MKKVVVVIALVVAGAIAQAAKSQSAKQPTAPAPSQTHAGRYQLFFSPLARADVYLLDTETGKIWKPITITNATDANLQSAPQVWVYQERVDSERDFNIWVKMHAPPAATASPQ